MLYRLRNFSFPQGYITRNIGSGQPGNIGTFAESALKKLEKMHALGAKRGKNQPTIDEVDHARQSIIRPPMFGSSVDDVMEAQNEKTPGLQIPSVLKVLTQAIIGMNGPQTEGIFRVPGDIDAVNALKLALNQNHQLPEFTDPHVPGSALKLWFRELPDPIIPAEFYESCISQSDNAAAAVAVVEQLPPLNRNILLFIVNFLQV